ncbi:conserved hypothetical protein [Culex quinquefasciatus]|uniref:Ionotropic glutamate receptor C-terminal domain-containing protein n=1 Tax=Culex quinquefasciatus TaxID=7176 RepID=B0WKG7_CULQU|nr:conserved hypothetical protein [Culex quinquefasciatus]|eukprot:XP_001849201.1 conserved hypothetical protein [Culex quinquefasciatus]
MKFTIETNFKLLNFVRFLGSTKLYQDNSFNVEKSSFTSNASLFYDKLSNLGGRSIRTGIVDYVPYGTTEFVGANRGNVDAMNSTLSKELHTEGFEGTLIVEFCKFYKCNLKVWPFGPDNWGYINDAENGEGMLFSPLSKKTEIIISSIYYQWVYQFLDYSSPIAYSSILILVPRAKPLPTVLTPLYPFNPSLWLTIFISLIVMTVVHYGISTLNLFGSPIPRFEKSIFDMISIYLDQAIIHNKSSLSYQILISSVLLSGVVLSNSYSGGLASVLTVPRYGKSLETIHDFAQSPYRWGVPAIAWVLAIFDAESVDFKTVVKKFDVIPDEEKLYRRTLAGDFGVGIELLNSQKITVGPYIREDNVHLFELPKEMLYYSYTTVAAQRGWPVMEQLNNFILMANQHGLVLHWERRTLRKNQSTRMEVALDPTISRRQKDEVVQALTVEHIFGPMFILLVGAAFATGIFVLEFMWHAYNDNLKWKQDPIK